MPPAAVSVVAARGNFKAGTSARQRSIVVVDAVNLIEPRERIPHVRRVGQRFAPLPRKRKR